MGICMMWIAVCVFFFLRHRVSLVFYPSFFPASGLALQGPPPMIIRSDGLMLLHRGYTKQGGRRPLQTVTLPA